MNTHSIFRSFIFFLIALFIPFPGEAQVWDVTWTQQTNVVVDGNTITSTVSAIGNGAVSVESIPPNTDGAIQIQNGNFGTTKVFGLTAAANIPVPGLPADYYFKLVKKGKKFEVWENGNRYKFGLFTVGDHFEIERIGTDLHFKHNGMTLVTATVNAAEELFAELDLTRVGSSFSNCQIAYSIPGFSGGDNLGNHWAEENISLNGNFLSNDGDSEGLQIDNFGKVSVSGLQIASGATDGYFLQTDASGNTSWQDPTGIPGPGVESVTDADNDTKIQVEESADEDIIRFDLGGTEKWIMQGSRLEPANTGGSLFIGADAGGKR